MHKKLGTYLLYIENGDEFVCVGEFESRKQIFDTITGIKKIIESKKL